MHRLLLTLLTALPIAASALPPKSVTLAVQNMTCALCPITVRKSLERVPGVSDVRVDFKSKTATVRFDPERTRPEALMQATGHAGYPSELRR